MAQRLMRRVLSPRASGLRLKYGLDGVLRGLAKDEFRALARGQDVLSQVLAVDCIPDVTRHAPRLGGG